jgi:hypothetical protein
MELYKKGFKDYDKNREILNRCGSAAASIDWIVKNGYQ